MKHVVDSSGWIEYFSGGGKATEYEPHICKVNELIIPALVIFEVYKKIKNTLNEESAVFSVTQMQRGQLVPLDDELAMFAADLSLKHKLAMADSIIYATAQLHDAHLYTSDADFKHLPDVTVI